MKFKRICCCVYTWFGTFSCRHLVCICMYMCLAATKRPQQGHMCMNAHTCINKYTCTHTNTHSTHMHTHTLSLSTWCTHHTHTLYTRLTLCSRAACTPCANKHTLHTHAHTHKHHTHTHYIQDLLCVPVQRALQCHFPRPHRWRSTD